MEIILVVGLFVALPLAALRWGRDSRRPLPSKELELGMRGFRWEDRPAPVEQAPQAPAPRAPVRSPLWPRRAS